MTREEARHQILDHWQAWKAGLAPERRPNVKDFLRFIATERPYLLPELSQVELRQARDWVLEFEGRER